MQSSAPFRPNPSSRQQAAAVSDAPDQCPFLGAADGPGTSHEFPSDANKCFSTRLAVPVSTIHQENYCLSSRFEGCPVYRERAKRANGAPVMPVTAIATTAAAAVATTAATSVASPAASVEPAASEFAHIDRGPSPAQVEPALSFEDHPLGSGSPLLFPWEEPAHPDFQADMVSSSHRRRSRRINMRPVIIALLLLALIPVGWWLWANARPGAGNGAPPIQGTVVTLPTLMATSGATGNRGPVGGVALSTAEPDAVAGAAAEATPEPTAEPTATDLENIAATATALFIDATPLAGCVAPSWWVAYLVEEGDTIEALAVMRGILPEELIVANCLAGPELEPGSTLLLPPVGVIALQPQTSPTPTAAATRGSRPGSPTRAPIFWPTPSFPVVIILTPQTPLIEPTDQPDTRPPARPTNVPSGQPTATAPSPNSPATSTPPIFITSTPPSIDGTVTVTPTMTPPTP